MMTVLAWVAVFSLLVVLGQRQSVQEWYARPSLRLQQRIKERKITEYAKQLPPSFKRSVIIHRKVLRVILLIIIVFIFFQFNDHVIDGHFVELVVLK